ncbi:MAG: glycoside hydrolase family 3 C-terminal domain-containing protein [Lentisphaeria bacterium]|nr:glycoside hydrolase family 3 C-terminal domain-containing protein [Lentisphaeria bacterium]
MEKFIRNILSEMTVEEKIELISGCDTLSIGKIPRLNIREVFMADGPQGIRREGGAKNTALMSGIALSASFDPELAEKYGAVIGEEARACGIRASLGPGINLTRTPLNGRTFEYYGEDPVLAGKIAAGYIRGCQAQGVAACPKHLALNNQEICRDIGNSICTKAVLRDLYLENFEIAVKEGKPHMVMSSYNKINGIQASECEYTQKNFLRNECGFDGVIVSDWGGTHDIAKALNGGQDLEMGGGPETLARKHLAKHIENGDVSMEVLDNAVLNNLRLLYRMGAFDTDDGSENYTVNSPENQNFVRQKAAECAVLLENKNNFLPLDFKKFKKIAVVGPSADFHHHANSLWLGGGSGAVYPPYEVTILQALQERFGNDCEINFARGVSFSLESMIEEKMLGNGFEAEYFENAEAMWNGDAPFLKRTEKTMQLDYGINNFGGASAGDDRMHKPFAARFKGSITPEKSGKAGIQVTYSALFTNMSINGKNVFNNSWKNRYLPIFEFDAVAGKPIEICIEAIHLSESSSSLHLHYFDDCSKDFEEAVETAKNADLVIFAGGTNHTYDKEALGCGNVPYADIPDLEMPNHQTELLSRIAEVNPNVIAVLINGSVLNVESFADKVPAVLEMFYPGMECGNSVIDILSGKSNPGGKLPCTWCRKLTDYPSIANGNYPGTRDANAHVYYDEGLFIGYRYTEKCGIDVRYPFGYGLSYSSFEYELIDIEQKSNTDFSIKVKVRNTSNVAGSTVVQLYIGSTFEPYRPAKNLRDFVKVKLEGNEEKTVELKLSERDFSHYDGFIDKVRFYSGKYKLYLGSSVRDIFAETEINTEEKL